MDGHALAFLGGGSFQKEFRGVPIIDMPFKYVFNPSGLAVKMQQQDLTTGM